MKKLQEDWTISSRWQRVMFILVILGELAFGIGGVYFATLFAKNTAATQNTDYGYLFPIGACLIIMFVLARIRILNTRN